MGFIWKLLIGIVILGIFITLLVVSPKFRYTVLNIIKNYWIFPLILVLLAIFANNLFMLLYNNATKIGMFLLCLGIVGMGNSGGRKLIVVGGIVLLIGYFVLHIPLY